MIFSNLHLVWWGWIALGFTIGAYLHCMIFRHVLHTMICKVLSGLMWFFHRSDLMYHDDDEAEIEPIKPIAPAKTSKRIPRPEPTELERQLRELLNNNNIKITNGKK